MTQEDELESYQTEVIPDPVRKERRSGCLALLIDTVETLLLALILFFGINALSDRVRVENISMLPTLKEGEFLLVNKVAYKIGDPQIGDIITFHYPKNPQENYIKRVIGLPGDEVKAEAGKVYVNGVMINEPYLTVTTSSQGTWIVPQDSLFVMGDNRNESSDSRAWGPVPMDLVVGKAVVIYWPLENFKWLSHPDVVTAANGP
jgi:signal peptidase I